MRISLINKITIALVLFGLIPASIGCLVCLSGERRIQGKTVLPDQTGRDLRERPYCIALAQTETNRRGRPRSLTPRSRARLNAS